MRFLLYSKKLSWVVFITENTIEGDSVEFEGLSHCEQSFRKIINQFKQIPSLGMPNLDEPLLITRDASDVAIGAVLSQEYSFSIHHINGINNLIADSVSRSLCAICLSTDLDLKTEQSNKQSIGKIGNSVFYSNEVVKEYSPYYRTICADDLSILFMEAPCNILENSNKLNFSIKLLANRPKSKLFATWQNDFVGPLPTTDKGNHYILVIMDDFSIWVEAVPMHDQSAKSAVEAVISCIVSRFGILEAVHIE
ncbi:hypothetical protein RF11_10366 [Thelohanellus kitauei]|uniref:Integrase catalytic domain-containing protein n=1 Tax=Thelohanellus kitauei TaxID=669202 RepID=A0A0C2J0C9_THEKT|nr:hypothetical protein RF11_10366 [Thelohanellus kitauei]